MKYERFEDLPVWKTAAELYHAVADFLETPKLRLSAGFRSQLDRSALSISNNIAEGFERVTTSELVGYLAIARGSAGEVRSMSALALKRCVSDETQAAIRNISAQAASCARQITAWIYSLDNTRVDGKRSIPVKKATNNAPERPKHDSAS